VPEMRVVAVGITADDARPVLLLEETAGRHRLLPVWVGLPEAVAIERERNGVRTARPMAHHLIGEVIGSFGRRLEQVCITNLADGVFHAELVLDAGTVVSARPSDAVALALHLEVPIRCEAAVLDEAAVADVEVIDGEASRTGPADPAGEIERFRRFLDTATPEDFDPS
jgi:uncharacterized protein